MHFSRILHELLIVRSDVIGVLLITHPATHVPFIRLAGIIIWETLFIALQLHFSISFLLSPLHSDILCFHVAFDQKAHSYR